MDAARVNTLVMQLADQIQLVKRRGRAAKQASVWLSQAVAAMENDQLTVESRDQIVFERLEMALKLLDNPFGEDV